ncbi:polysaccharide biosynthesis/export family protein [Roseivirga misakiensis]|uniref:Polysaccharide export protein N-terminal domain-containing protein n=1 Tax=Roseivirga misakiensis TaxID=1563681 RepID=A0A1E5T1I5_9BACT|nr:polysaccharide biosynthesis/export family protein [Roseivirga misakiensis]OEK05234.1 hypothetical protein BFP71_17685 [Roseivirga misakiensis]
MTKDKTLIKKAIFLLFVCGIVSSCIPNEKVVYLQNKSGAERLENEQLIALSRVDYKLQPNDILLINFYSKEEEEVEAFYPIFARPNRVVQVNNNNQRNGGNFNDPYLTGYNIDKDGNIEINALGRVKAAGLTTSELKYEIERQIKEKAGVNDILVGVKLSGIPYTIYGEVRNIGQQTLRQYEANLFQAIASAGDLTINADRAHVTILRQYPDGIRIHEVDVTDRAFLETEQFFLQPDDIIYVPPLKIRELGTGQTALQTFATIVSVISGTAVVIGVLTRD